jgi:hypothetical protein
MKTAFKGVPLWLLGNFFGIFSYLLLEAWIRAPHSEADSVNVFDIMHFWLTKECPVLIVFLILNLIWLNSIIRRRHSDGNWRILVSWLLVCVVWGGTLCFYGTAIGMLKIFIIYLQKGHGSAQ